MYMSVEKVSVLRLEHNDKDSASCTHGFYDNGSVLVNASLLKNFNTFDGSTLPIDCTAKSLSSQ